MDAAASDLKRQGWKRGSNVGALSQRYVALRPEGEGLSLRERTRMGKPPPCLARRRAPAALVPQAQPPRGGADARRRRQGRSGIKRHPRISRGNLSRPEAATAKSL